MSDRFTSDEINMIARFVQQHIGFSYAESRVGDLIRGFCAVCKDMGCVSKEACLSLLNDTDQESVLQDLLIKKLTIGETYFFRDKRLFSHLSTTLLPELIQSRRLGRKYLRIWCAACSSGEEPYSLAILLQYLIPDIHSWDITLIATDINIGSLHAAERGVYSKWSFREEAPVSLTPYVTPSHDGRFEISPDIKKMVRFSRLNLITDLYPSTLTGTTTMDLILCRNVLMYFSSDLAGEVITRLNQSLITGGWLIVSPQEISYAQKPGFVQVKQSSVFLFRKGTGPGETRPTFLVQTNPVLDTPEEIPDVHPSVSAPGRRSASRSLLPQKTGVIPKVPSITRTGILPDKEHSLPGSTKPEYPIQTTTGGCLSVPEENPDVLIQSGRLADAEFLLGQQNYQTNIHIAEMEMLARAFADQGDIDRALGWCDRILAIDPLHAGAYHLRAVIEQDRGDDAASVQSLKQALYADPDYLPAHMMLGMIMKSLGKLTDSTRHYQVALQILATMPDDAPVDKTDGMPAARVREMVTILLKGAVS